MNAHDLTNLVGSLGFPVGVCIYLLWERRTTYQSLRSAIHNLASTVAALDLLIRERLK